MFHVTVNSVPVPAVAIHNVTYVEVEPAEKLLGINFVLEQGNKWGTPFEDVTGVRINGNLYTPWYTLARNIHAERIDNSTGWNFDTVDNVVTATPVVMPNNMILFWSDIGQPDVTMWQLDTGAFEPYVGQQTASALNLPNLGSATASGVGGVVNVYESEIPQLTIGNHTFYKIPCIVDPNWNGPNLFGYRFFFENDLNLYVDKHNFTLDIVK